MGPCSISTISLWSINGTWPESVLASIISSGSRRFWCFSHLSMAPLIMCEELLYWVMGSGLLPENVHSWLGIHSLLVRRIFFSLLNYFSLLNEWLMISLSGAVYAFFYLRLLHFFSVFKRLPVSLQVLTYAFLYLFVYRLAYGLGYLLMDELSQAIAQFYPSSSGGPVHHRDPWGIHLLFLTMRMGSQVVHQRRQDHGRGPGAGP